MEKGQVRLILFREESFRTIANVFATKLYNTLEGELWEEEEESYEDE